MINRPDSTWVSGKAINFESGRGPADWYNRQLLTPGKEDSEIGGDRQNQSQNTSCIFS